MKKNIKKVKKFQKILICLAGILILLVGITIGNFMNARADEINYEYGSDSIGYNNENSSLNATNVKDAIDELYGKVGQCPTGQFCYSSEEIRDISGGNILRAYMYDENSCVTGDETGCEITTCYSNLNKNSCSTGTIVDYFVNDTKIVRFHVLHDDGETMTMQAQKNTIYNVAWYSGSDDNTKGPQTIMAKLKEKTDSWTNVNPITITSGTTSFPGVDSIDNVCGNNNGLVSCSGNVYDIGLIANTYRARMITLQEATNPDIGQCKAWVSDSQTNAKSCRMFMNNYLYAVKQSAYCKNVGLCVEDDHTENGVDHNWGYWTMGAYSSAYAWRLDLIGGVSVTSTSSLSRGARAVVVINK